MKIATGIGISTDDNLVTAVTAAARQAAADAGVAPKLVLAFITHSYTNAQLEDAVNALAKEFPSAVRLGGTVNGISYGDERYDSMYGNRRAVAVVTFGGDGLTVGASMIPKPEDPVEGGKTLARVARERLGGPALGGIMLGTGINTYLDQPILNGIRAVDPRLRLTGTGLAGGLDNMGLPLPGWGFYDTQIELMGPLLILFGGQARIGFGAANGMQPAGPGAFVTDAEGPAVKTLNGKPAKGVVLDLLVGPEESELRSLFEKNPVVMAIERGTTLAAPDPEGDHYWCHMPVAFLPDGTMIDFFQARKGTGLSVVHITPATCLNAVDEACAILKEDAGTEHFETVLAFSCALRGFTLGAEVAHEDGRLRANVKARKQLGVVACGEIASHRQGRPFFTGWVYTVFGLAEDK
jgi:hypothetical protein